MQVQFGINLDSVIHRLQVQDRIWFCQSNGEIASYLVAKLGYLVSDTLETKDIEYGYRQKTKQKKVFMQTN